MVVLVLCGIATAEKKPTNITAKNNATQTHKIESNVTVIVVAWILQIQTCKGFYQEKDAQKSIVYFLHGTPMCMREGMKQIRHVDLFLDPIRFFLSLQEILDDDFWRNKYYVWKRRTKMPMTMALFFSISIQILCKIGRFHAIWHPQGLGPKRLVPSGGIFLSTYQFWIDYVIAVIAIDGS